MDRYDKAIANLTERVNAGEADAIQDAWGFPGTDPAGCLFESTGRNPRDSEDVCGCLTQVRRGDYDGPTPELTALIRADARIPCGSKQITLADLPVFAEWQRKLDTELGRVWVEA